MAIDKTTAYGINKRLQILEPRLARLEAKRDALDAALTPLKETVEQLRALVRPLVAPEPAASPVVLKFRQRDSLRYGPAYRAIMALEQGPSPEALRELRQLKITPAEEAELRQDRQDDLALLSEAEEARRAAREAQTPEPINVADLAADLESALGERDREGSLEDK